ncbi:MAG: hypothetical protein WC876_09410 [Candidatus Thermoplasmatota archaeon]|jgi:hypothetical protein
MGLLQRWLDEPDESIARLAKTFYTTTYLFLAIFLAQLVFLMLLTNQSLAAGDLVGPVVSLFLALTMYNLAIDGRRSYKLLNADRVAAGEPTVPHE